MNAGLVDAQTLLARTGDLPIRVQEREHVEKMLRAIVSSPETEEPTSGRGAPN